MLDRSYTRMITEEGMGNMQNFLRVMYFPVFRQRKV